MPNPVLFSLEQLEAAFDDLRRLLDAQLGPNTSQGRFLLDDVETDIRKMLLQGLTKEQLAEITAAEIAGQDLGER